MTTTSGNKALIMLRRATVLDEEASKQLASRWSLAGFSPSAQLHCMGSGGLWTFGSNL